MRKKRPPYRGSVVLERSEAEAFSAHLKSKGAQFSAYVRLLILRDMVGDSSLQGQALAQAMREKTA